MSEVVQQLVRLLQRASMLRRQSGDDLGSSYRVMEREGNAWDTLWDHDWAGTWTTFQPSECPELDRSISSYEYYILFSFYTALWLVFIDLVIYLDQIYLVFLWMACIDIEFWFLWSSVVDKKEKRWRKWIHGCVPCQCSKPHWFASNHTTRISASMACRLVQCWWWLSWKRLRAISNVWWGYLDAEGSWYSLVSRVYRPLSLLPRVLHTRGVDKSLQLSKIKNLSLHTYGLW
jgi:hypothetical protein